MSSSKPKSPSRIQSLKFNQGANSKITITPIVEGKKLTLKPPRYSYLPNSELDKKTAVQLSPLNSTRKPALNVANQPMSSNAAAKRGADTRNSEQTTTTMTSMDVESSSKSVIDLKQRLKELRERLLEDRKELGSFDFGSYDDDNDDNDDQENQNDANEIEIVNNLSRTHSDDDDDDEDEHDEKDKSSEGDSEEQAAVKRRGDRTFVKHQTSVAPISSITIRPKPKNNSNLDSLDIKTLHLIAKSESSLTDTKLVVSSDGLMSSSRSTSISSSSVSSDYPLPTDMPPFRPEFIKFIEKDPQPSNEHNPLKQPEDDILYQWRLRRKMEQAAVQQKEQTVNKRNQEQSNKCPSTEDKKAHPISTSSRPQLVSAEVQTVEKVDLATQTSLEMTNLPPDTTTATTTTTTTMTKSRATSGNKKNLGERIVVEVPTRDAKQTLLLSSNKPANVSSTKSSGEGISPTSRKKQIINKKKCATDQSNIDLTKVSSLESASPALVVSSWTSSSSSSSLSLSSSVSSMTNITSRVASPNPIQKHDLLETNRTPAVAKSSIDRKKMDNKQALRDDDDDDDDDDKEEIFENDEILQILMRKKKFYEIKLRQIDGLLVV